MALGNINVPDNNKLDQNGNSKDVTTSFTSSDTITDITEWTNVEVLTSDETHSSIFSKISKMFKNIRYLWKIIGTTDISGIANGTVSGGVKEVSTKVSGDVIKPDTLTNTTTIVNTVNKHTASMKNTMMNTGVLVTTTNQALNRIRNVYYSGNETLYAMVTATSGENNEKRNVALVKFTLNSDPVFKTIESDNLTITEYNSIGTFQYSDNTNIKIKAIVMDRDLFYSMWNDKSKLDNTISDAWNSTKTYYVGDYCIYNNSLWKCLVEHSNQLPSEGTYWTKVNVGNELTSLKNRVIFIKSINKSVSIAANTWTVIDNSLDYFAGNYIFTLIYATSNWDAGQQTWGKLRANTASGNLEFCPDSNCDHIMIHITRIIT